MHHPLGSCPAPNLLLQIALPMQHRLKFQHWQILFVLKPCSWQETTTFLCFSYERWKKKEKTERFRYKAIDIKIKSIQNFLRSGEKNQGEESFLHESILDRLLNICEISLFLPLWERKLPAYPCHSTPSRLLPSRWPAAQILSSLWPTSTISWRLHISSKDTLISTLLAVSGCT